MLRENSSSLGSSPLHLFLSGSGIARRRLHLAGNTLSLRRFTPNAKQGGFKDMSFNDFVDAADPNPCACGTIFPRKIVDVLIF